MILQEIADRHGFSVQAVENLADAFKRGGGSMAQFNHPEFGGMGQWSSGMLMIGAMGDDALKRRVHALCEEVGNSSIATSRSPNLNSRSGEDAIPLKSDPLPLNVVEEALNSERNESSNSVSNRSYNKMEFAPFKPFNQEAPWWPDALGEPSSVGSQNDAHYAYFPSSNRLAIKQNSKVTIYDTGAHQIHGASQQQSSQNSLTFDSQLGRIKVSDLKEVKT